LDIGFINALFFQLDKDDMVYMEAYDKLLESWLTLVQDDKHFHKGFFTQHAVQVFNSYIQCHLAAPDGTRNLVSFLFLAGKARAGGLLEPRSPRPAWAT
jgi:hypothetical protein